MGNEFYVELRANDKSYKVDLTGETPEIFDNHHISKDYVAEIGRQYCANNQALLKSSVAVLKQLVNEMTKDAPRHHALGFGVNTTLTLDMTANPNHPKVSVTFYDRQNKTEYVATALSGGLYGLAQAAELQTPARFHWPEYNRQARVDFNSLVDLARSLTPLLENRAQDLTTDTKVKAGGFNR